MEALILEDERSLQEILKILLEEFSFNVTSAYTLEEARNCLRNKQFDIALIDLRLPDGNGMEIVEEIKTNSPETEVVIITAFASAETIKKAFELGVYDYIEKPFKLEDLRIIIRNIKDKLELKKQVSASEIPQLIGKSPAMEKLKETIMKIAPYDVNVLITGESGTGKELVAKAIHNLSNRKNKPFVAINCAALPSELLESELFGYKKGAFTGASKDKKGLIEVANGGTLFLDEIGDMPTSLQAKLLRFLETQKFIPLGSTEEKEVNVRIIAATNKNLKEEVKKGNFREDLFYRLSTIHIHIPPLRERKEDIPLLADFFTKELSQKYNKEIKRISQNFIKYLMNLPLEGNVRELKNIIEREIIMCDGETLGKGTVTPETTSSLLPPLTEEGVNLKEILKNVEKEYLLKALELAEGKKTEAAKLLGLTFREFRYRLSKLKNN